MTDQDRFGGLLRERRGTEAYPLFVGAVAVSQDGTLITDKRPFTSAIAKERSRPDLVPNRFRLRVQSFDLRPGYLFDVSDETDRVFRMLNINEDHVRWINYWDSIGGPQGRIGYLGEQYIMEDVDAKTYIAKEGFTPEELDWLWGLAMNMHVVSDKPVVRREL